MSHGREVSCVLCQRSEETRITGALSTKDEVMAHQNCLLFSSGIFCRDSPQFHDLFGFSVDDVLKEVKRGSKLVCSYCKKRGATAGCEEKRCKKSYHYPCAVQEEAKTFEDTVEGKYGLYCSYHDQRKNGNGSVTGLTTPRRSKSPSEAGSSKDSLESVSNSIMLYCHKHASSSHQRNSMRDSTGAGPSRYSTDSNTSNSGTCPSFKRRRSGSDMQDDSPSKRRAEQNGIISEDSSSSDENEPNTEMQMFAPLESDLDESANSVPEDQTCMSSAPQFTRKETERPTGSPSGNQPEEENGEENDNEDETLIASDAESESLLLPVEICIESQSQSQPQSLSATAAEHSTQTVSAAYPESQAKTEYEDPGWSPVRCPAHYSAFSPEPSPVHSPGQHTNGPPVPQQTSTTPPPSPDHPKPRSVTRSPPCNSSAIPPAPSEPIIVSRLSSSSSPTAPPTDPNPIDSTSFWKSCNAAGCTQSILTDFINGMKDISSRIQSDEASQEDYHIALSVLAASGKLEALVAKQQKELQRKQLELQKAAAAMKEVISVLKI